MNHERNQQSMTSASSSSWRERALERLLADVRPRHRPRAFLVLGQPGAGKGSVVEDVVRQLALRGNAVVVDTEELKYFHPTYAAKAGPDDRNVMPAIGPDIESLATELLGQAIEKRFHLVGESASADTASTTAMIERLKESSYHVTVLALAVASETSWQAVADRCRLQQEQFEVGTWIRREFHDTCRRSLVDTLEAIERQGKADELHIITRFGERLLSAGRKTFRVGASRDVLEARFLPTVDPHQSTPSVPDHPSEPEKQKVVQTIEPSKGRKIKLGAFPTAVSANNHPLETGMATPPPQAASSTVSSSFSRGQGVERKIKLGSFSEEPSRTEPTPPNPCDSSTMADRSGPSPRISPHPVAKRLIVPPQRTPDTAEAVPTPAPVPNEFKEFIEREPSNGDDSRPVQVHPAAEPRSQRLSGVSTPPTDKSPPTPSAKTAPDGSAMHSSSEDAAVHHRRMLQEKIRRRAEA